MNKQVNLPSSILEAKVNTLSPISTNLPQLLNKCKDKENHISLFNQNYLKKLNNMTSKDTNQSLLYCNININHEDDNETQFMNISDKIYENLLSNNVPEDEFQNCQNIINNCKIPSSSEAKNDYLTSTASTSQNSMCISNDCYTVSSGLTKLVPIFDDEPELYGMCYIEKKFLNK